MIKMLDFKFKLYTLRLSELKKKVLNDPPPESVPDFKIKIKQFKLFL